MVENASYIYRVKKSEWLVQGNPEIKYLGITYEEMNDQEDSL